MPWVAVAAVVIAAAGTAMSMISAKRAGQVGGDTAMLNAKLRAKEQIGQAQQSEYEALVRENDAMFSERSAVLSGRSAGDEREATAFDLVQQRNQGRAFQSQQRAEIGGSGLEATGSPLLVMAATAKELELDREVQKHAGEMRAREHEEEARLSRQDATMSRHGAEMARYTARQQRAGVPLTLDIGRYQARAARSAGNIQAVSSLVSGTGRAVGSYYGARG